jgi:pimeloyl-ACP methyl ester carboxylesterase
MRIITNSSISPQERIQEIVPYLFQPASWFKAHPDYLNYFYIPREIISEKILHRQLEAASTWTGTCNALSNITQPTLVVVGTDDDAAPDSLTLAEKIPGSWLIRIGTAGHGLMYQHPEVFNTLIVNFLENSRDHKN